MFEFTLPYVTKFKNLKKKKTEREKNLAPSWTVSNHCSLRKKVLKMYVVYENCQLIRR